MKLGIRAALVVAALAVLAAPAAAVDIGVLGKKLVLKTNILNGTSLAKLTLKDPAIAFPAGTAAATSGTLEVQYLTTANSTTINMPSPWFANTGFLARFKNSAAPGGGSLVKSAIIQAGKIAKVSSKGIGTLVITSPPPAGIRTMLTVTNGGNTTRLCTQWTVVSHKSVTSGNKIIAKNGTPTACPALPTCFDSIQNQDETCIDGGGVCVATCGVGGGCSVASDCSTNLCVSGTCRCPNQSFTFVVNSNSGGAFDSAEWPGGTATQNGPSGCSATINRPDNNVDLVCTIAGAFSVNSFAGYSNCFGTGGEDGDGCQVNSCPPAGVGSCCNARPSCSAALNGSAQSQYTVQCLQ
jgi:hypothetical protein